MKSESYYLINDHVRNNAIIQIKSLPTDGKLKIVISNSGTKSAKQRSLNWLWNTEVANAGIGGEHEDTKENVHRVSKFRWCVPILIRDDEFFAELFSIVKQKYSNNKKAMMWFIDEHVSTEAFTVSQMTEYLTDFQRYYETMVSLTNPQEYGL